MRIATKSAGALTAALALLLSAATPAFAEQPAPNFELPAGIACSFPLRVVGSGDGPQAFTTFTDRDGQVRTIIAGTGHALTFTNLDTGATTSTRATGGLTRSQTNADGSITFYLTGNQLLILFPSDEPAGPSTIVHSGRVVYDLGADGSTFTVRTVSGKQLDICAALGG
jgi:hypothetical protein